MSIPTDDSAELASDRLYEDVSLDAKRYILRADVPTEPEEGVRKMVSCSKMQLEAVE